MYIDDEVEDSAPIVEFLSNVNKDQDKDNYRKEREANKEQKRVDDELRAEQRRKANAGKKMSAKDKVKKDYEAWRKGTDSQKEEIKRRAALRKLNPHDYFNEDDTEWRLKPPTDHDPAGGWFEDVEQKLTPREVNLKEE